MRNLYFNVTKYKVMHIERKNEQAYYKIRVNEDEYGSIAKCNEEKGEEADYKMKVNDGE